MAAEADDASAPSASSESATPAAAPATTTTGAAPAMALATAPTEADPEVAPVTTPRGAAPAAPTQEPASAGNAATPSAGAGSAASPSAGPKSTAEQVVAAGKAAAPSGKRQKREAAELVRQAKRAKIVSEAMVVFGLGNVGTEAMKQRHNIGQQVLQGVIARTGATALEDKEGATGVFQLPGEGRRRLLVPPQGAINDSGPALKSALEALGHPQATILAVVDDTALALGLLRLRQKGSSGGHNGLRSIEDIWGEDYHRLRLGINRSGGEQLKEHVLGEFQDAEKPLAEAIVRRAVEAVELWLSLGPEEMEKVMAKVNSPNFRKVAV
mmetsp:Transcript_154290/g.296143  ORF Transcript_154290/g.296143 Transcript_154290/m.296143 type:complete len:326 (+) Transcript_154290:153-1130(+)